MLFDDCEFIEVQSLKIQYVNVQFMYNLFTQRKGRENLQWQRFYITILPVSTLKKGFTNITSHTNVSNGP